MLLMQKNIESRLISRLEEDSPFKSKESRFVKIPAIPTGFNIFDIYSGFLVQDMFGRQRLNGGIYPRLVNIVGESATGKSSLLYGLAPRAVDYMWNTYGQGYSEFFVYDSEDHTPDFRLMNLAKWSPADFMNKCSYTNNRVSLVQLYNHILKIYSTKMKYKKDFLLPTGIRGIDGKEVLFIAPTIICVDSVSQVLTEGFESLIEKDRMGDIKEVEALSNNIDAMRDARAWTIFTKKSKPFLDEANVSLYMVNHKIKEQKMSMFEKEKRFLPFLEMGEKLQGGKENIYQSFHVIDLASGEKFTELNPVYGDSIRGWVSRVRFVKSKSNIEGVTFPMVFDQLTGFHQELSDFEYLWQNKYGFEGTSRLTFDILPEISFTRKTLIDTLDEYPALGRALAFTARFKASHQMLYYKNAPSLHDMRDVSLAERLALIYAYTNPYNYDDYSDAGSEYSKIAQANRHFVSFDLNNNLGQNILQNHDLQEYKDGYQITDEDGVSPFDFENTKDGQYFYSEARWKEMDYKPTEPKNKK